MTKIAILVRNLYKQCFPKIIIHVFNIHSQSATKIWEKFFGEVTTPVLRHAKGVVGVLRKYFTPRNSLVFS